MTRKAFLCSSCGSLLQLIDDEDEVYREARLIVGKITLTKCPYCITRRISVKMHSNRPRVLYSYRVGCEVLQNTSFVDIVPKKRIKRIPENNEVLEEPFSSLTNDEHFWLERYKESLLDLLVRWRENNDISHFSQLPYIDRGLLKEASSALANEGAELNWTEVFQIYIKSKNPQYFLLAATILLRDTFLSELTKDKNISGAIF